MLKNKIMITGKNQIGNKLSNQGDKIITSFNPELNKDNTWQFTEATPKEIEEAVALANIAFEEYKYFSGEKKASFLNSIADEILALGDALLDVYVQESGLPRGRAEGERARTVGQLRAFANMLIEGSWVEATIDTAMPDRQPLPRIDLRKMLFPIGPVVVFGSSNFPFAFSTAGGDTASALAAGCPVIVKSHSMHIATGDMVASAIIKAAEKNNMPNGIFSNLNGGGKTVGAALVTHPLIKAVGFTGSISGGRALFNLAAQRQEPIPVFAEMGSINPVVLLPSALSNHDVNWAASIAGSITLGAGQFCTNPGLLVVIDDENVNQFILNLALEFDKIAPACMLHHSIKSDFETGRNKLKSQDSVTIVAEYTNDLPANYAPQTIIAVDSNTFLNNKVLSHEVFGPFSVVVKCKNEEDLINVIQSLEGQLTGTLIGDSFELSSYSKVIATLQNKVGRLIFNGVPTGVEVSPAMTHGGPYPASSDSRFTAVGINSVKRWVRPVSFQNWPNELLPNELKDENPLAIYRTVDLEKTKCSLKVVSNV